MVDEGSDRSLLGLGQVCSGEAGREWVLACSPRRNVVPSEFHEVAVREVESRGEPLEDSRRRFLNLSSLELLEVGSRDTGVAGDFTK